MVYINEIKDEEKIALERIRGEILGIIGKRSEQETNALNRLVTFMGIISSGSTIAILGFIGQQSKTGIPAFALLAFAAFASSLLSFAYFLYSQFQLHSARWALYANTAEAFFTRGAELEDVVEAGSALTSKWTYRRLFWIPFLLLGLGFILSGSALWEVGHVGTSAIDDGAKAVIQKK
ncbi:hypothetical protein C8J25_103363 [Sphingomonas faeni]|uniref:Uncharacterized protein n=1 Tax=Sphingomonas faeni TaxID=185950 RepID=A0A2T5U817_9SPHN|nr:hypothetical protein [Sphingomonas faeni]PTW47642.1 hypothetical protein C8J25_103363 [Sphingomonas faeni]